MKLPVIKHAHKFIAENDQDYVIEALELLEHMCDNPSIADAELDVLGELISNLYGALEVHEAVKAGKSEREALNEFMERVVGSIDK